VSRQIGGGGKDWNTTWRGGSIREVNCFLGKKLGDLQSRVKSRGRGAFEVGLEKLGGGVLKRSWFSVNQQKRNGDDLDEIRGGEGKKRSGVQTRLPGDYENPGQRMKRRKRRQREGKKETILPYRLPKMTEVADPAVCWVAEKEVKNCSSGILMKRETQLLK